MLKSLAFPFAPAIVIILMKNLELTQNEQSELLLTLTVELANPKISESRRYILLSILEKLR